MKVSEVIEQLQEIKENVGDVEVHIETDTLFDLCRDIYLLSDEGYTNKMAVISKDKVGFKKPWRNAFFKRRK